MADMITCFGCGRVSISPEMLTMVDGEGYCQSCFDELFSLCTCCGVAVHNDDAVYNNNNDTYCHGCYDSNYVHCYGCGEELKACYSYISAITNERYCEDCHHDIFTRCESCDCEIFVEDAYHDDIDFSYCGNCYNNRISRLIHDYGYKPEPNFYQQTNEKTKLYFGIELEIESGDTDWDILKPNLENMPDFIYLKEDGSINNGFELVMHPATYNWFGDNLPVLSTILTKLGKMGCVSYKTTTCGIHIHISKEAFTTLHLLKFLTFFYNSPEFILKVSQRTQSKFKDWCSLEDDESLVLKAKTKNNIERHTAVNLQNVNTVEVRIFRGTLNYKSFYKNLEFCKSVYDYTKECSLQNVRLRDYLVFIENRKKEYENLVNFLLEKGWLAG